jgi:hypothetical protein
MVGATVADTPPSAERSPQRPFWSERTDWLRRDGLGLEERPPAPVVETTATDSARAGWPTASNSGGAALARHFAPNALRCSAPASIPGRRAGSTTAPCPALASVSPMPTRICRHGRHRDPPTKSGSCMGCWKASPKSRRWAADACLSLSDQHLVAIRTVGGGARNPAWTAIPRHTLSVEWLPAKSEEAAVGAAALALAAVRKSSVDSVKALRRCGFRRSRPPIQI